MKGPRGVHSVAPPDWVPSYVHSVAILAQDRFVLPAFPPTHPTGRFPGASRSGFGLFSGGVVLDVGSVGGLEFVWQEGESTRRDFVSLPRGLPFLVFVFDPNVTD